MIRFQCNPRRATFALINRSNKLDQIIEFLKPAGRRTKVFAGLAKMKEFLNRPSTKQNSVILIISVTDAYTLREKINAYPQIHSIIIYYYGKVKYERWVTTMLKLKTVLANPKHMKNEIERNYLCRTESMAPIREAMMPRDQDESEILVHIDLDVSSRYYVSKLLINYLIRSTAPIASRDEWIRKLDEKYLDDPIKKTIYQEFFQQYDYSDAISCILSNASISQSLSDAFSNTDAESLLLYSDLFRDAIQQLTQYKHKAPLDVYFGQMITIEVLKKLRKRIRQHVVCSSLLLATTNRSLVDQFHDDSHLPNIEKIRVLYHIHADPATATTQLFAFANQFDRSKDEERIIFMIGSLFRIDRIEHLQNGTWIVHMTLCDYDNNMANRNLFNDYTQRYMRNDEPSLLEFMRLIVDLAYTINSSDFVAFADEYLTNLLSILPENDQKRVEIYDLLGLIEFREKNLDVSISWYEKSIQLQLDQIPVPKLTLIKSYRELAQVYYEKKNYHMAINFTEKECNAIVELGIDLEPNLHIARIRLASAYESMKEYKKALSLHLETLVLMMKHNSEDQVAFAFVYHKLGNLCQIDRKLPIALGFYQSALEAHKRAYPNINVHVANTYKSLAILYLVLCKEDEATQCFGKAAAIYAALRIEDRPSRTDLEQILRSDQQPPLS